MKIQLNIESIFLEEIPISDIWLNFLLKNEEYINFIQTSLGDISKTKEYRSNETSPNSSPLLQVK